MYLLSGLTSQIWNWCIRKNTMIQAEHLPGVENIWADWESRHLVDSRLETRPECFSISIREFRSFHNRSICLKDKCTAPSLLQLEGRPNSTVRRCPIYSLNQPLSIHVSSFPSNILLPSETEQGEGVSCYDSASMPNLSSLNY